jgi:hypothetical protein
MLTRVESGFEVPESREESGVRGPSPEVTEVCGVIVDLDDLVATVEMGAESEEWVFPRSMLPVDIQVDSVLTFEGVGSAATVVAHRHPGPTVEDRLSRSLNRRRLRPT